QLDEGSPSAPADALAAAGAPSKLSAYRLRVGIGVVLVGVATFFAAWMLTGEEELTPQQQVLIALQLSENLENPKSRQQAIGLVRRLNELKFRDPDFAGAQEYILGMIAFHDARQLDDSESEQHYSIAARNLR